MTFFQRQNGATLLEVLVAIIVLSFGLLGMAGLQTASLRVNQGALQRSQAVLLAYDILDQMRGSPDKARAGGYDIGMDDDSANTDVTTWKDRLEVSLGTGAKGGICQRGDSSWAPGSDPCADGGRTGFFVVQISWSEADLSSGSGVVEGRITQTAAVAGRVR